MLHKFQIVIVFLLIPLAGIYLYTESLGVPLREMFRPSVPIVRIGEVSLRVAIASTDAERIRGLSGQKQFPTNVNGVLFVFDKPDYYGMWMKDMYFPIDIIWIGEDLTVVDVTRGVQPESYPNAYRPKKPAKYVIETDVHYTETVNIAEGQKVTLPSDLETNSPY